MNKDREAMLFAFKTENEVLTRQEIMKRAFVTDKHKFQSLVEMKWLDSLPWRPGNEPREFMLTGLGSTMRELQNVAENLGHG